MTGLQVASKISDRNCYRIYLLIFYKMLVADTIPVKTDKLRHESTSGRRSDLQRPLAIQNADNPSLDVAVRNGQLKAKTLSWIPDQSSRHFVAGG